MKIVKVESHLMLYQMYMLWLSCYTIRRFTKFGVDSVQTGQAWIAHRNKGQCHGVCGFCSGNRLLISSHSKYIFKNCSNFPEFPLYKYIYTVFINI